MTDETKNRTWAEARDEMHAADPELAQAYEESRPAYLIAREVLRARRRLDLTQTELADRVGVTQSQVSRIERMETTPSLTTVHRYAEALGMQLDVRFVEPEVASVEAPSGDSLEIARAAGTSIVQLLIDLGFVEDGVELVRKKLRGRTEKHPARIRVSIPKDVVPRRIREKA